MLVYLITFTPLNARTVRKFKVHSSHDVQTVESTIKDLRAIDPHQLVFLAFGTAHGPTAKDKSEKEDGQHWCPYCWSYRYFYFDAALAVLKCSICGISENDKYVRQYNGRQ